MSRYIIGVYTEERSLVAAAAGATASGYPVHDAYTPYAVHGLDEAMGLRRSRLTWVCLVAAATGATLALCFQVWTSSMDWPLNIGGKPAAALPAFVPVTFEFAVLLAGLTTVGALLFRSRLWPGKAARMPVPGLTDDQFALVLHARDSSFDFEGAHRLLADHGAREVIEVGSTP